MKEESHIWSEDENEFNKDGIETKGKQDTLFMDDDFFKDNKKKK